jgi:hypothetical protein
VRQLEPGLQQEQQRRLWLQALPQVLQVLELFLLLLVSLLLLPSSGKQ